MADLVDTNVLVYAFDGRDPGKRRLAEELLREGRRRETLCVPHQAIVEFVSVIGRPTRDGGAPLLLPHEARLEAERLLAEFPIVYPNEQVFRLALWGAATYRLAWFDAHLWAYAAHYGMRRIWSEDFTDGALYGPVTIVNPFSRERP